ncbi:MAG: 4-hydroxy-3-methylbut-2-enyl diphosphate reductase [Bacteroidales bacterium]|jgi:4-hydroxy-3-methylbut-2-enyl diphosphate reductase|nr:4-hydroxy-3-methylbut-2-enyl diphosphate reductase [Bacteroidales bacterium]
MKVDIEQSSGFCFGVENAVAIAEDALRNGETVYCLGEIVHNDIEVSRLTGLGLKAITYEEFANLRDCKVLIRAHGEPPSTYAKARENNITIIDATCPIVRSMQEKIRKVAELSRDERGQIVIYGKEGHAEVIGLMGAAGPRGILVTGKGDLHRIDYTRPVFLFSQTTKSKVQYEVVAEIIRLNIEKVSPDHSSSNLKVHNTICRQVSGREPRLREFAMKHHVIIFVSGRNSSNGRMLFEVCLKVNPRSYFISSPDELNPEWFRGAASAGVCGATSTPRWLIQEVAELVAAM